MVPDTEDDWRSKIFYAANGGQVYALDFILVFFAD